MYDVDPGLVFPNDCLDVAANTIGTVGACEGCPVDPEDCRALAAAQLIVDQATEIADLKVENNEHRETAKRRGTDPKLEIATREVFHEKLPGMVRRVLDPNNPSEFSLAVVEVDAMRLKLHNEAIVALIGDATAGDGAEPVEIVFMGPETVEEVEELGDVIYVGSMTKGDKYLKLMVDEVLGIKRELDEVYRTGGDEITVVISNAFDARRIAARYRRMLNEYLGEQDDYPDVFHLGVYVGYAMITQDTEPLPTDPKELDEYIKCRTDALLAKAAESMNSDKRAVRRNLEEQGVVIDPEDDRKIISGPRHSSA